LKRLFLPTINYLSWQSSLPVSHIRKAAWYWQLNLMIVL
jgi:hypothetical protein